MADDYDDNILLDSDEERAKAKKTKDFIPKPRLLTAPASKLAAIAGHLPTGQVEDNHRNRGSSISNQTDSPKASRSSPVDTDNVDIVADPLAVDPDLDLTTIRHNVEYRGDNSPEIMEWEDEMRPASALQPSNAHLVDHPSNIPPSVRVEEGTYKRLISDTPLIEQCDETKIAPVKGSCLCRICRHPTIRKNWKVYVGSLVLSFLGIGLMAVGLVVGLSNEEGFAADLKSVIFLVGGILLFVPGAYHLIFLSLAAYDVRGFKFSKIPTIK